MSVPRVVKSTRESRSSRLPKRGGVVVPLSLQLPSIRWRLHRTDTTEQRPTARQEVSETLSEAAMSGHDLVETLSLLLG